MTKLLVIIPFFFAFYSQIGLYAAVAEPKDLVKTLFSNIEGTVATCKKDLAESRFTTTIDNLCQTIPSELIRNFSNIAVHYQNIRDEKSLTKTGLEESAERELQKKQKELKDLLTKKSQNEQNVEVLAIAPNFEKFCSSIQNILKKMLDSLEDQEQFNSHKAQFEGYIDTIIRIMKDIQARRTKQKKIPSKIIKKIIDELTGQQYMITNVILSKGADINQRSIRGVIDAFEALKNLPELKIAKELEIKEPTE